MLRSLRSLFCAALLLTVVSAGRTNAQSIGFGLMAGGSLSTFTGDLAEDAKNYGGFIAGGFIHASFAGFAVQPGLFYTQKGAKSEDEEGSHVTNKLNYIQIPLVVKLSIPFGPGTRLHFGGGPAIGVNIGCRFTVINGSSTLDEDCDEDLGGGAQLAKPESTELSAIGVAGIDIGKFSLGLRADFGISNTYKELIDTPGKVELKTRTISAIASIRF